MAAAEQSFAEKYGPWALVTGAAEGLGAEFANQIAARGINVALVDVQIEKARAHAEKLAAAHGVETRAVECDLAAPDFMQRLEAETRGFEIGLLICCAALGTNGAFLETPLESMKRTIQINCMSTLELCFGYAKPMVARRRGGVVVIASNSAYSGSPYVATYAATKAFDLSLGEALWYELAPSGVDVLAFSPQGTNTPGLRRGMPDLKEGETRENVMLPSEAVGLALAALGNIASTRPDMPEKYSRAREAGIKIAGDFLAGLQVYTAE